VIATRAATQLASIRSAKACVSGVTVAIQSQPSTGCVVGASILKRRLQILASHGGATEVEVHAVLISSGVADNHPTASLILIEESLQRISNDPPPMLE
jgi:hypothetical protein